MIFAFGNQEISIPSATVCAAATGFDLSPSDYLTFGALNFHLKWLIDVYRDVVREEFNGNLEEHEVKHKDDLYALINSIFAALKEGDYLDGDYDWVTDLVTAKVEMAIE